MTKQKSPNPRAKTVPAPAPEVDVRREVIGGHTTGAARKSIALEQDGTRREIETPLVDGNTPAGRFSATRAKGVYIYEYAQDDSEGRRVYRHVSTEPV